MASDLKKEYYASASVTFTIRVRSHGHWGKDATVAEVMEIGGRETVRAVEQAMQQGKLDYDMIGTPKVGAITWSARDN